MKPFDLEAAKRGEPIVTRSGHPVSEFHHFETEGSTRPCIAIIGGSVNWYDTAGANFDSRLDLFMAPRKRTVYVNVYAGHATAEIARVKAASHALVVALPVEIED